MERRQHPALFVHLTKRHLAYPARLGRLRCYHHSLYPVLYLEQLLLFRKETGVNTPISHFKLAHINGRFLLHIFIVNSSTAILHTLSYHTPNSAVPKDKKDLLSANDESAREKIAKCARTPTASSDKKNLHTR